MKSFLTKAACVLSIALASQAAKSQTFQSNKVTYKITGDATVEVAPNKTHNYYMGNVNVPQTVSYNGKSYTVTAVGHKAFKEMKHLSKVSLPASVQQIKSQAFADCNRLLSVNIPEGIPAVEDSTFFNCWELQSANIPQSVSAIGKSAFQNCQKMTRADVPPTVQRIGSNAFNDCEALQAINIPNGIQRIEDGTYSFCQTVKEVVIPNTVTAIGKEAFLNCKSMSKLTFPGSVTSVGEDAFWHCDALDKSQAIPAQFKSSYGREVGTPDIVGTEVATANPGGAATHQHTTEVHTDTIIQNLDSLLNVEYVDAQFPGGDEALSDFIVDNVQYPADGNGDYGSVKVEFTVNVDGSVSDVKVNKPLSEPLNREAIRVIQSMPEWTPATENGKPVARTLKVNVPFTYIEKKVTTTTVVNKKSVKWGDSSKNGKKDKKDK